MTYDFSILHDLRKTRNMTIADLGEKCGVSYVSLSKLEHNEGNPELRTLDRIAQALGLSTHNLLALADRQRPIQATEQSAKILGKATCRFVNLDGTRIFLIRAPKGAVGSEPAFHCDDYERCFVIDGRLKINVRENEYILEAGDGLVWDSIYEHAYQAMEPTTFIKVLSPKHP